VIFIILLFIVFQDIMKRFYVWNPDWDALFRRGIYFLIIVFNNKSNMFSVFLSLVKFCLVDFS